MEKLKYPRIPHLPGSTSTEDDIHVVSMPEGPFHIFEKLDGANVGIIMNTHGELEFINRGSPIQNKRPHEQWGALKKWAYENYENLHRFFSRNKHTILYGEWLWARHSIKYDLLPDFFIAFDVYSILSRSFYPHDLARLEVNLSSISFIKEPEVILDLNNSFCDYNRKGLYTSNGDLEGYIFRRVGNYSEVYKYVLPEFQAGIEEHWFNRAVEKNKLQLYP